MVTYYTYNQIRYYICVIIDLFARKVVVWKISKKNSTQLTKKTFMQAYSSREITGDLLFHSDQGSNFVSKTFMNYLKKLDVKQSFSKPGRPYDNSVCESFFSNHFRIQEHRMTTRLWSLFSAGSREKSYTVTNTRP